VTGPLLIIPAAIALDWLLGDPRDLPHPIVGIGKLISLLETALRRAGADGRYGGVLLVTLTVAGTTAAGWAIISALYQVHPWVGIGGEIALAWFCLAAHSLHRESALVATALQRGDLPAARQALANIVGRDTAHLEEPEIWRGAVETVAENTADGVIAPLFYLMLGGPVLALAYKAVNTLDSMVGYRNERYLHFGWAAARLDDLANWLPARLTGLLMVATAPLIGLSSRGSWQIMRRDGRNHASPNSGIPEAAAAGALAIQLGGTNWYFGQPVVKPTIGDETRPLDWQAWWGSIRLLYGVELLALALFIAGHLTLVRQP
jgi:adenosylcobinamide-phosphate synthase